MSSSIFKGKLWKITRYLINKALRFRHDFGESLPMVGLALATKAQKKAPPKVYLSDQSSIIVSISSNRTPTITLLAKIYWYFHYTRFGALSIMHKKIAYLNNVVLFRDSISSGTKTCLCFCQAFPRHLKVFPHLLHGHSTAHIFLWLFFVPKHIITCFLLQQIMA